MPKTDKTNIKQGSPTSSVIAITGTNGFIGRELLSSLVQNRTMDIKKILAVDIKPPQIEDKHIEFVQCDLTAPHADRYLAQAFSDYNCDTLVHAALHSAPKRNQEFSHELQSIGSMYLLHAANSAKIRKLILSSTTEVYGAFPDNPLLLTESHPLRGGRQSSFLRDRIDVEKQFTRYAKQHEESKVSILRPCTILGPTIRNYKTHLLRRKLIWTVLGFDPQVQFVHEDDVLRAFTLALRHDVVGALNIVGKGVVPLSRALQIMGIAHIPVASSILRGTASLLWHAKIQQAPAAHLDFMQYPCVADGERAADILGFKPTHSLRDVLLSFQKGN